jgi:transposase
MTKYITLQGCRKVETKQLISAGNEAKLDTKSGTSQTGYTKEFKDQLVEIYNSGIYESAAECARNYKVPERLLYQWLSASKKQAKPGELSFELAKLKKENADLKMENAILKKATVYFAKQMK